MDNEKQKFIPRLEIRRLYDRFNAPVTAFDCGKKCAPHNPNGIPFCCDICHAVPVAYHQEWDYLQKSTDLWHKWRGDECAGDPCNPGPLEADTPEHMLLLACRGPAHCQRSFRTATCRQFPFFPYITADDRFIGLAYNWTFEPTCWVISNLGSVTEIYRKEFVQFYDELLALWPEEHESYAVMSEEMREFFSPQKRRIPLLHRNGRDYLISPGSEHLERVSVDHFRRFGPYQSGGKV